MHDSLVYFLTWTTYGTWLPGDQRGWVKKHEPEVQSANSALVKACLEQMTEAACFLNEHQREIVEQTIRDHCLFRKWNLFALNCRSNHVHVVVHADVSAEVVERQLKAWCSRRLNEDDPAHRRERWWTKHGWVQFVNTDSHLKCVIEYVVNGQ